MPIDLCVASTASFFRPCRFAAVSARVNCVMMSTTMVQWKNWATPPQRTVVLRSMQPKLMPMHEACKTRALGVVVLALLGGCATRAPQHNAHAPQTAAPAPALLGRPYQVVSSESLLIV